MATYKKCTNGHMYDTIVFGEKCPFCQTVERKPVRLVTQSDLQECSSTVKKNVISIGRVDCDIILDNSLVSRHHADIMYVDNFFLYYDYGKNGTIIDGFKSRRGDVVKIPDDGEHEILLAGNIKLDWGIVRNAFSKYSNYNETHKCCCIRNSSSSIYYDRNNSDIALSYLPQNLNLKCSSFLHLFGVKRRFNVYCSVFAPAEIAPKQHLMVQVYLHLPEETEKVKSLASEADKNAERRGYEPLEVPLKKGDNVEIELNVNGDSLLFNCRKSVVWQGSFVKRAFDFIVPSDINTTELSCSVNVFVNGAIAGELIFLTAIVDSPRRLNTNVCARPTKKLFISYSHKDIASAEKIAKIHEALGIDVFFDKHRLKAGYIYSEEISKFIQTADTFVLCWSENAAKSDYVEKERQEALSLAYPQYKPRELARLRIHPYNIEPHAVPPADMIEHYHFEEL